MRTRVFGIGLIAVVVLPFVVGTLRVSSRVIVPVGDVVEEDLYAIGDNVIIEGLVRGDVFAVTGKLDISGRVEGDVLGLVGGTADISGQVDGSIRLAAVRTDVGGSAGDDLAVVTVEGQIDGTVGRDLLFIGAEASVAGEVGRDVRIQTIRLGIDGTVGRDVLARVDSIDFGSTARVDGDVLYKASSDAEVADGAVVIGQFTRRQVLAPVWVKAVARAFSILSLLGLIVAGLAAAWVFRFTSRRAVETVAAHPWRSAARGLGVILVPPLLVLPLFLTLVGIPIAVLLLIAWVAALFLGPLPAVTQVGTLVLRGKGGLPAAIVVGVVIWRGVMWVLPLVAGLLYLAALLVGLGAYASAGWGLRAEPAK